MNDFNTPGKAMEAEEWDLMEQDEEKDVNVATKYKEATIKSLRIAIKTSHGAEKKGKAILKRNARIPRAFKCHSVFLAFKLKQIDAGVKSTKLYTTAEVDWNQEYSVDLSHEYQDKVNKSNGIMTKEGMVLIYGKFIGSQEAYPRQNTRNS